MGEVVQWKRWQMVMTFLPVYSDGSFSQEAYRFGPFPDVLSSLRWQKTFTEWFYQEKEKEKNISDCRILTSGAELYDARDTIWPIQDPQVVAEDILALLVSLQPTASRDDSGGLFIWRARVRMRLADGGAPFSVMAVCQPFANKDDILPWYTVFEKKFHQQAFQARILAFSFRNWEDIPQHKHEHRKEHYLLDAGLNPVSEGIRFFRFMLRHSIAPCRAKR